MKYVVWVILATLSACSHTEHTPTSGTSVGQNSSQSLGTVERRLEDVGQYVQRYGPYTTLNDLKTNNVEVESIPGPWGLLNFAQADTWGGPIVLVIEGKEYRFGSVEPSMADISHTAFFQQALAALRQDANEKIMLRFEDNITELDGRRAKITRFARIWGARALLNEHAPASQRSADRRAKFFAYIVVNTPRS